MSCVMLWPGWCTIPLVDVHFDAQISWWTWEFLGDCRLLKQVRKPQLQAGNQHLQPQSTRNKGMLRCVQHVGLPVPKSSEQLQLNLSHRVYVLPELRRWLPGRLLCWQVYRWHDRIMCVIDRQGYEHPKLAWSSITNYQLVTHQFRLRKTAINSASESL